MYINIYIKYFNKTKLHKILADDLKLKGAQEVSENLEVP